MTNRKKIDLLFLSVFGGLRFVLHHFDIKNRKATGLAVRLTYSLSTLANFDIASY